MKNGNFYHLNNKYNLNILPNTNNNIIYNQIFYEIHIRQMMDYFTIITLSLNYLNEIFELTNTNNNYYKSLIILNGNIISKNYVTNHINDKVANYETMFNFLNNILENYDAKFMIKYQDFDVLNNGNYNNYVNDIINIMNDIKKFNDASKLGKKMTKKLITKNKKIDIKTPIVSNINKTFYSMYFDTDDLIQIVKKILLNKDFSYNILKLIKKLVIESNIKNKIIDIVNNSDIVDLKKKIITSYINNKNDLYTLIFVTYEYLNDVNSDNENILIEFIKKILFDDNIKNEYIRELNTISTNHEDENILSVVEYLFAIFEYNNDLLIQKTLLNNINEVIIQDFVNRKNYFTDVKQKTVVQARKLHYDAKIFDDEHDNKMKILVREYKTMRTVVNVYHQKEILLINAIESFVNSLISKQLIKNNLTNVNLDNYLEKIINNIDIFNPLFNDVPIVSNIIINTQKIYTLDKEREIFLTNLKTIIPRFPFHKLQS